MLVPQMIPIHPHCIEEAAEISEMNKGKTKLNQHFLHGYILE